MLSIDPVRFFRGVLLLAPLPILMYLWVGGPAGFVLGAWAVIGIGFMVFSAAPSIRGLVKPKSTWGSSQDEALEKMVSGDG